MQWIVPYAAPASDDARALLRTLQLPHLQARLTTLTQVHRDDGEPDALSPPHERALARALGFAGADGELPWGAWLAQRDGIAVAGDLAWGLVTPVHWEVAADHVRLADPQALQLAEADARVLFDAVHPLFVDAGLLLVWGAPLRWYAAHESLAELPCASLDRVIGRAVDAWMPGGPHARLLRRLQNEVQMLLYAHGLNEEREARGLLPVNSFWLSGCGLPQAPRGEAPQVADALREPALAGDWAAWGQAWAQLDAELGRIDDPALSLVLCGERSAVQFDTRPRSLLRRLQGTLRPAAAGPLLESL
jgi:hypothetical protein